MKLKNLIKNKLIVKQKGYLRFFNLKKETNQILVDNNNNLSLIIKKTSPSSKQILGYNEYSNLSVLKYKNLQDLNVVKNTQQNLTSVPYISKITNTLINNSKSLTVIKPVKGGFITILSNGTMAFMDKSNLVKVFKALYKTSSSLNLANFLLKSTGLYKNANDFFKLKVMSKIKAINFKFKIKKGLKKNLLSDKNTNLKIIVENFYNQNKKN